MESIAIETLYKKSSSEESGQADASCKDCAPNKVENDSRSKKKNSAPLKRISAELHDSDAIELELIRSMLRVDDLGNNKVERDTNLIKLFLKSFRKTLQDYKKSTGVRYPMYEDVNAFLDEVLSDSSLI